MVANRCYKLLDCIATEEKLEKIRENPLKPVWRQKRGTYISWPRAVRLGTVAMDRLCLATALKLIIFRQHMLRMCEDSHVFIAFLHFRTFGIAMKIVAVQLHCLATANNFAFFRFLRHLSSRNHHLWTDFTETWLAHSTWHKKRHLALLMHVVIAAGSTTLAAYRLVCLSVCDSAPVRRDRWADLNETWWIAPRSEWLVCKFCW